MRPTWPWFSRPAACVMATHTTDTRIAPSGALEEVVRTPASRTATPTGIPPDRRRRGAPDRPVDVPSVVERLRNGVSPVRRRRGETLYCALQCRMDAHGRL